MKKFLALLLSGAVWANQPIFLEDLYTETLQKVDLKAQPAIVTFIQPGCIPCRRQLKELQCVFDRSKGTRLVLAMQITGQSQQLRRELKALHLGFPILKASPEFLNQYQANGLPTPTTFVFAGGVRTKTIEGPRSCSFWMEP